MVDQGQPVLVVGGTGALGCQVVGALRARGKPVRALVRRGSDVGALEGQEVEVVRGDMMDPASLGPAFDGVDALVTSAVGYTRLRKGDTTLTDTVGNRNLADAAKNEGIRRFVFTGILNAHEAPSVPHFWHKKLAEDYLEGLGVAFVSLRPGAFLDQVMRLMGSGIAKGRLLSIGSPTVPLTYVLSADVAQCLAEVVDAEGVEGERIDIGWDHPLSMREVARISSNVLGREIRVRTVPWWLLNLVLGAVGRFSGQAADIRKMVSYFQCGRYVADPTRQREVFGQVPSAEEGAARWLRGAGFAPATGSVAASAGADQGRGEG
jgi:uncharacterized protein YbjT (DUF2867 family)